MPAFVRVDQYGAKCPGNSPLIEFSHALGAGAAYQRVEPFDLSIQFVADATFQDQSRVAVVIGSPALFKERKSS